MASERVERLAGLADVWNRGDVDGFLEGFGPNFEFTPDPSFPDGRRMSGEELRTWMHEWAQTWPESQLEVLELEDHGAAGTVRARWHLRPSESEVELPVGDFTFIVWFDEADLPSRSAAFFDHEQALRVIAGG
jgi:hypothetical protein